MLVAPHFLVGAAIAMYVPEAGPAALAAITSHFVLDSIPHRDTIGGFHINKPNIMMEVVDAIVTFGIFFGLVPQHFWAYGLLISGIAILPDLLSLPGLFWPSWYQLPIVQPLHNWHTKIIQYDREDLNWFWGLLPQILIVAAAVYFIITKPL